MNGSRTRSRGVWAGVPRGDMAGTLPRGALGRECPTCGAKPGYRCTRLNGRADAAYRNELKNPHDARRGR